jgi:hypothetical protein
VEKTTGSRSEVRKRLVRGLSTTARQIQRKVEKQEEGAGTKGKSKSLTHRTRYSVH